MVRTVQVAGGRPGMIAVDCHDIIERLKHVLAGVSIHPAYYPPPSQEELRDYGVAEHQPFA